jgi:hypothetical protein
VLGRADALGCVAAGHPKLVGGIATSVLVHARGITRLHGFGVKTQGLIRWGPLLTSADSMAWSYAARRQPPLPGCETRHITCANCPRYAYQWHARIRAALTRQPGLHLPLFDIYGDAP